MRSLSAPGHFLMLSAEQNLSLSFVQFVSQGLQFPQLLQPCFLAGREKNIKFYGLPKGTIREEAFIRCYLQGIGTSASRGVLQGILGGGVPPGSPKIDPISDQKVVFSTSVFRPGL